MRTCFGIKAILSPILKLQSRILVYSEHAQGTGSLYIMPKYNLQLN